ncbi:MAG: hypothetical protein J6Y82_04260 [Bacteroidales bacterium]|nr:hypothetical protein [Bacteroidales bacterium]
MKNALKLSILTACCAVVCACANKQPQKENLPEGYTSGRLLLDELKGQVTKVIERSYPATADGKIDEEAGFHWETTYNYSPEGDLLSVLNDDGDVAYDTKTIRSECEVPNRISKYSYTEKANEEISYGYEYTYEYDNEGFVTKESCNYFGELSGSYDDTYTYNADHEVVGIERNGNSDELIYTRSTEITVKERDKHGNWTSRFLKSTTTDEEEEEPYSSYSITEREITYAE